MSALLVFLETQQQVTLARKGLAWESFGQNSFVVSEEISSHGREVYLWGDDVRGFTAIPARGGREADASWRRSMLILGGSHNRLANLEENNAQT